jgi:transcriptional regulator with XRE-family HTH domain
MTKPATLPHRKPSTVAPAPSRPTRVPSREARRLERLQELLGLTQAEVARLLELSPSTLARRPLAGPELDRLRVLEELGALAAKLVPRPHVARWLAEGKEPLGGSAPRELLATESGRRALETFLLRALDGTGF